MKQFLAALTASLCLLAGAAAAQVLSPQQIKDIVASPDRSPADRTNDLRRKPEQMLEFIAVHPGITALDLSAAGGYTTELLARAIGPTGKVFGQSRPRNANQPSPAAPEGNSHPTAAALPKPGAAPAPPPAAPRPSPVALAERDK